MRLALLLVVPILAGPLLAAPLLSGLLDGDLLRGYRSASGAWGRVRFHASLGEDEERLSAGIGAALRRVEERLGRSRGRPFTAVLAPGRAEFSRVFEAVAGRRPEGWISGSAFPGLDLLLVRGEAFPVLLKAGERPDAVLEHELAHLVIHRRAGVAVPRWLDEGLALRAARRIPEPDDEAFLSGLARIRSLYSLEALEREVPASHDLASIAYLQCLLLQEWMVHRFGDSFPGDLLDSLEAGVDWRAALEARAGMAVPALEEEFRRWLAGRRSLVEVLIGSINFWTVAALLALVAIARAAIRRRWGPRPFPEEEEGGGDEEGEEEEAGSEDGEGRPKSV